MKVTVEISDSELSEVCKLTGEMKKGPAIRKLVVDSLMLKRREAMTQKFIAGELGVELKGIDGDRPADRKKASRRNASWRT